MKFDTSPHPQLQALKVLWGFPDEILNKVLWVNTIDEVKEQAIGMASEYLDFMDQAGYKKPEDAWVEWCDVNGIEHEANNCPYLN